MWKYVKKQVKKLEDEMAQLTCERMPAIYQYIALLIHRTKQRPQKSISSSFIMSVFYILLTFRLDHLALSCMRY